MTDLFSSTFENGKELERRKIEFIEDIIVDGVNKGTAKFELIANSSKLYVEQMECLIFS